MSERDVTLRDGRTLHVYDRADPDGKVVVEHHGTPGSGLSYPPDLELARERGLRVIAYDPAGYGGSTPNTGRGAGRCVANAAIASPAPWDAVGLDWLAGQGEQNVAEWDAALKGVERLEAYLEPLAEELRAATPEQIRDVLVTLLPPVDRDVLTGDRARHVKKSLDRAIAPGVAGWRDDDLAFSRHWGFELRRSAFRSCSGRGCRTRRCRLRTASGSQSASPTSRRTSARRTATSRSR